MRVDRRVRTSTASVISGGLQSANRGKRVLYCHPATDSATHKFFFLGVAGAIFISPYISPHISLHLPYSSFLGFAGAFFISSHLVTGFGLY